MKGNRLITFIINGNNTNLEDETFMPYDFKLNMNTNIINQIQKIHHIQTQTYIPDLTFYLNTLFTPQYIQYIRSKKEQQQYQQRSLIIRLNKGELCDYDAYSAFVYHINYFNPPKPLPENDILLTKDIPLKTHSTGLLEFISYYYFNKNPYRLTIEEKRQLNNLEINVCGLVTNICVIATCIGGLNQFRDFFIIDDIKYSRSGINIINKRSVDRYIIQ